MLEHGVLLYMYIYHTNSERFLSPLCVCCSFYNLDSTDFDKVNRYLSSLVEKALIELESSNCLEIAEVRLSVRLSVCLSGPVCLSGWPSSLVEKDLHRAREFLLSGDGRGVFV